MDLTDRRRKSSRGSAVSERLRRLRTSKRCACFIVLEFPLRSVVKSWRGFGPAKPLKQLDAAGSFPGLYNSGNRCWLLCQCEDGCLKVSLRRE